MPRVSEAEKLKSHRKILDAAARLFRQKGIDATSVSDVMSAAGLTHGGFYRHFSSKDDLVAEAFRHAVDTIVSPIEAGQTEADRSKAVRAYVETYLSGEHVRERGTGCPLAAVAAEVSRSDGQPREAAGDAMRRMAGILGGPEKAGKDERGLALMALLLGTVTLARLADDEGGAEEVLSAGRSAVAALDRGWADNEAAAS